MTTPEDGSDVATTGALASGQGVALLQERLAARMATREGELVGFDPITIIMAIIGVIMSLIQGCTVATPKTLKNRFGNRALIALGLKKAVPDLSVCLNGLYMSKLNRVRRDYSGKVCIIDENGVALMNCNGDRPYVYSSLSLAIADYPGKKKKVKV
mgnify:CR=1 FL=1